MRLKAIKNNFLLLLMILFYCHSMLSMDEKKDHRGMVKTVKRFSEKQRYQRSSSLRRLFSDKFTLKEIKKIFDEHLRQFADEFESLALALDYLLSKDSKNLKREEIKEKKRNLEDIFNYFSKKRIQVKKSNLMGCCQVLFDLAIKMQAYKNILSALHKNKLIKKRNCVQGLKIAEQIVDFASKIAAENQKVIKSIEKKHLSLKTS